ncbi:CotH kinase family protein [Candidatus Sumerlaeota bacterium]|nr:CotH kinase family protein [Candidatus Sumerlaeota bacterium]
MRLSPLSALLASALIAGSSGEIVINEIQYHPERTGDVGEFIELLNVGESEIALGGWSLGEAIDFTFPAGASMAPGAHLVVAHTPASIDVSGDAVALGPWSRRLSNRGERLVLRDAEGHLVDEVCWSDHEPWPTRADGQGPSLELINPSWDNGLARAWHESEVAGGTPGSPNSVRGLSAVSRILDVHSEPVLPGPSDPVRFTARVAAGNAIESVALRWRPDLAPEFATEPMVPVGDDLWEVTLPPQPEGNTNEFCVEVHDAGGQTDRFPRSAPERCMLWQVVPGDLSFPEGIATYHIVMSQRDWGELMSRDPMENGLLSATFIAHGRAWHGVGIRLRGKSSRFHERRSFRVEFQGGTFNGIRELNLNGTNCAVQRMAADLFQRAGLPAPHTELVALNLRGDLLVPYLQVESYDDTFLTRWYGEGRGGGALFRGEEQANLDYRGEDFAPYREHYIRLTNEWLDDLSAIVALCDVFTNTDEADFGARIPEHIDIDQWIRFFAVNAIMNNAEGGISNTKGDDYHLCQSSPEGRFEILPWDLDGCLLDPIGSIHMQSVPAIARLLRHPAFAWRYHLALRDLMEGPFARETMMRRIDELVAEHGEDFLVDHMRHFVHWRHDELLPQIPLALRVSLQPGERFATQTVLASDEEWWSFVGAQAPTHPNPLLPDLPWHHPDARPFEMGFQVQPGPFGLARGGLGTDLSDSWGQSTSLYLRRSFDVPNPRAVTGLRLHLATRDGFAAYLNGEEVLRRRVPGLPGSPVGHDAVADLAERGPPESGIFDLSGHIGLLLPGPNTFAVHGLMASREPESFLIGPSLEIDALPTGVALDHIRPSLSLRGVAPVIPGTREVLVNGEPASLEVHTGRWTHRIVPTPGLNTLTVLAVGDWDRVLDEMTLDLISAREPIRISGTLSEDSRWTVEDGPRRITSDLTVSGGITLRIEAGAVVALDPGVNLHVEGSIIARGNTMRPVIFTSAVPGERWGQLRIINPDSMTLLDSCRFDWGTVMQRGGELVMRDCAVRFASHLRTLNISHALRVDDCTLTLSRCAFIDNEATVMVERPRSLLVQGCLFLRTRGDNDAIDIDGVTSEGAVTEQGGYLIENCVIDGAGDDGIDWFGLDITLRNNVIRGARDKAISVELESHALVENNLIVDCTNGIEIKHGARATVVHSTILGGERGLCARTGGSIDVTDSIVWGQGDQSVVVEEDSTVGGPLVANGEWGMPGIRDPLIDWPENALPSLSPVSPCHEQASDGGDIGYLGPIPDSMDSWPHLR